jgi:hypothetical protein
MPRRVAIPGLLLAALSSCASVVRYTDELVYPRYGRTWFTRVPAAVGGGVGFAIGIPIDIVVSPASWVMYRSVPKETRDPVSVFLFPSWMLWKVGVLLATPFDVVEWTAWRAWQEPTPLSREEREEIERGWDAQEYPEYPVRPVYPLPVPDGS